MNHQKTAPFINAEPDLDSNREIIIANPMPKVKSAPSEPAIYDRSQDKIPDQNWENHTNQPRHTSTAKTANINDTYTKINTNQPRHASTAKIAIAASVPSLDILHLTQAMVSFSNTAPRNSAAATLFASVATTPVTTLISLIC